MQLMTKEPIDDVIYELENYRALEVNQERLNHMLKYGKTKIAESKGCYVIGLVNKINNDFSEANAFFEKAYSIYKDSSEKNLRYEGRICSRLAQVSLLINDEEKHSSYFSYAEVILKKERQWEELAKLYTKNMLIYQQLNKEPECVQKLVDQTNSILKQEKLHYDSIYYLDIAVMYLYYLDNNALAVSYFTKAKELAVEKGFINEEMLACYYLGVCYMNMQHYEEVLLCSIPLIRENRYSSMSVLYVYPLLEIIAKAYIGLNDFQQAEIYINKLDEVDSVVDEERREQVRGISCRMKAEFHLKKPVKEVELALYYINESKQIYDIFKESFMYVNFHLCIFKTEGDVYAAIGEYEKAINIHKKSVDLAISSNNVAFLSSLYKRLSAHYEKLGNGKLALDYFKKYDEIKLAWYVRQSEQYTESLHNQYELDEKEHQIEELQFVNENLKKSSHTDKLTNIPNRRYIDQALYNKGINGEYVAYPMTMLMIDVDYFKKYNDNYGHLMGDEVLKLVASAISGACKRKGDIVARYGGEEFIVVLEDTTMDGAGHVSTIIMNNIRELNITHDHSDIENLLTVSIGIATVDANNICSYDEVIEKADRALYLSKQNGRNRYTHFRE